MNNNISLRKTFLTISVMVTAAFNLNAVVPVHINSGDPAFPFPQFVEYTYGKSHSLKNLATNNPEGVVHAEMEQDIRDAYQIFANEWKYTGEELGGVKYIQGNIGCPYDCREGDGYSLLAAAVMGDKVSFDGLWMCAHDKSRVKQKRYIDGVVFEPNYEYGDYSNKDNQNSATDGDVDMAIALYIAWRQWGDDMGIKDFSGEPISYKNEFFNFIKGMVAVSSRFNNENPLRSLSGDIGFDGYLKNGDTWSEITDYVSNNPINMDGTNIVPEFAGPCVMHTDYLAPAYFYEFYELLNEIKPSLFSEYEINQFKRCAASCDWVVGNWISQAPKNIFVGEEAKIEGDKVSLEAGNQGGRFRSSWRTALNYMWHGNPDYTWNPITHQVEDGGNTYEYDGSVRFANFMNDPQTSGNSDCLVYGTNPLSYKGPATLHWDLQPDGSYPYSKFNLNWTPACGLPSAISAQDMELAGILYRHCNIEWDIKENGDGYLTSVPVYFHGWFRLLGMLVATGNHIAPSQMVDAKPNLKIYRSLKDSMTLAYVGDKVNYILDYRNYGSVDAEDVEIVEHVPEDFVFVSASDGGVYNSSTHTIKWKIDKVAGFRSDDVTGPGMDLTSGNLAKTVGQVSYVARVSDKANGRYCTTATISCSNGSGWTSNEYPNHITATMQRNCVDVINRSLKMEKKANLEMVNPGNLVQYTINFENSSKEGWLDGGRPRVNVAFCNNGLNKQQEKFGVRLYSDAIEPYINYGNYRISYYMYDPSMTRLKNNNESIGWEYMTQICEFGKNGDSGSGVDVSLQKIVNGQDPNTGKKWNQRIIIKFPDALVTTTAHLLNQNNQEGRVHKGVLVPFRLLYSLAPVPQADVDYSDDWSWDAKAQDEEDGSFYPITPSYQRIDPTTGESIETPVNEYLPNVCNVPGHTISNVLVEEYDGYVWRRILGTGPTAGREYEDVMIIDTLPKGMEFVGFEGKCPLEAFEATWDSYQIADGRWVVKWQIPYLQRDQKGKIVYNAKASFPSGKECQTDDELTVNYAWMSAKNESAFFDTSNVTVTCAKVPDPMLQTTMVKTSDKERYEIGDDITYTIEYEQTHGYITKDATEKPSDWTLSGGASISGGKVTGNTGSKAKYNYSYASNIYLEMDCEGYNGLSFYLRDNVKVEVKKDWATMTFVCYEGSTKKYEASIVSNASAFNLKVELIDDILRIWMDKDTIDLADFTVEKLKPTSGFFSIESGTFSNIYIHTDYAYDLTIVDRKPAEVSFESADNGGVLKGDSIVWEFEHGIDKPIPWGTKYTLSWKGTVEECEESIINVAYAKLLSYKDGEIGDYIVNKCIDESCEGVQKAEISIKDAEICAGDSTVLKAVGTPKSSKYEYEFFLGNTSLGKASSVDSFIVKEMGDYKVKISDPSCPTASAVTSKSVSLVVDALPDEEITDKAVICKNESLKLGNVTVDDHTIEWYADINKAIEVDAEDIPAEDVRNTYYYVLTDKATGCKGEVKEWDVVINDVPSTPTVKPEKELPLKDGVSENITNMASATGSGNHVVWYKDETAAIKDSVKAPILVDLSNEGKVTYYVREKSPEGCIGDIVPVSVVITSSQKPNPNDTTICVGEEIDVTTLVEVETGSSLIWYDENGNETTAPGLYSSDKASVKEFTVAQTNGTAVSEKSTFSVTTVEVAELKDDEINYCAGDAAVELKATVNTGSSGKTPTSYKWYLKGQLTTDLIPQTDVKNSRMYSYEVEPVFEIPKGNTCVGKKASVVVNVDFVPAVMPGHAIYYTLSDAVGGKFPTLTEQDPTAVVPSSADNKLVWYDAKGNIIGETAPSPDMVTEDTTVTYKVKQVNKNGCESEFQDVTVIITKTPVPETYIAYYCVGDIPDPITEFVKEPESNYSLIWYDDDPKKGGTTLPSAPTIDVTVNPGEVETVRKYYVAQGNATETSSATFVEVHIFAKPQLLTRDSASCGEPIDINGLWLPISKKVEFTTFYTSFGSILGQDELVTKSGTYRVVGGIYIGDNQNIKECISEKSPIKIEVHSLGTVEIEGPDAVCPNSTVELKVNVVDEEVFDSTLTYTWNKPNNSTVDKEFLSDPIKQNTTFSVTLSDGICTKKFEKEVTITNGVIDGQIEISEADNDNSPVKMNASADGAKFHSCGGDVTILADVAGSDFVWQDGTTGNTVTKKGGVYKLTYKDANGCETGFAVEIVPNPIVDNTLAFDTTLCEGENVTLSLDITAGIETPDVVWKKDGTEISTDATIVLKKVTSAEAGEYTYEATNRGCRTEGTFGTLTVLPRPTYTIKDVDVVCAGESEEIGLETLSPATAEVEWAPSPSLVSTGNTAVVTPEQDETYSFTISQNGGCKITEKISVKVAQPIDFKIAANDTTICENNVGNLKFGLKIVEGDVLSYEWKNEKDEVVSTSSVLKFSEKEVGTYKYTAKLTSEACPSVTDDIEVAIVGVPLVDTVTKIDYHNVEFVPNENYGEAPYEYKVDANEFSTSAEAYVTYGYHTVVIKDHNGCMSSYEFVTEAPDFEIPTLVTPNGDGVNDAFISDVIAEAYPDAVVTIYDRFGKKLVEMKGNEAWDGTYLGRKMPATDYWYEIWIDEIRKKYVGHFTLIND